jgi:hypothetical protein
LFGTEWTAARVADALIAIFRQLPGTSFYSPRVGVFKPSRPVEGLELITAVQACLGRESPAARLLLTWARVRAGGGSFQMHCRETGYSRSTAYYQRDRSLKRVAAWLNRERAASLTVESVGRENEPYRG